MKTVLGALAVVTLAMTLWTSAAEARCWWNGFTTVCSRPYYGGGPYWRRSYYRHGGYYGYGHRYYGDRGYGHYRGHW